MVLKIGDKGPVVEFINSYFNILGDVYTQETENRVKQFQQSYKQIYRTDLLNPYPLDNIEESYTKLIPNNNGGYDVKISTILPVLWPNGTVDLKTMTGILDTDVEYFDFQKVLAVRRALNMTKYSDYGNIFIMLCEMALNLNFRLDDNLDFVPLLVDKTIKRIIGADKLVYAGKDHVFESEDLVDYHLAEFKIHGSTILNGHNYRTKTANIIDLQDISETDKNLYSVKLSSTFDLKTLDGPQTPDSPIEIVDVNNIGLSLFGENQYGKTRFEETLNGLKGRQTGSIYQNNTANFKIIPGDFEKPLNLPNLQDYITEDKRHLYFNTNGNPLYIARDINSVNKSFNLTEYIVWMDNFYRITKIDEIVNTTPGYKLNVLQNKGNSTRVLYLCCADATDSVEINNFGMYTTYKKIDVNVPGLKNIDGNQDVFDIISGKYKKFSQKLTIRPNVSFDRDYDEDKNLTVFRIRNTLYGVDANSVICNMVPSFGHGQRIIEYNSDAAQFTFIFVGEHEEEAFTNFLDEIYASGKELIIYYTRNFANYYFNNPAQINVQDFRYIRANIPNISITVQYRPLDALELGTQDISGPNPYYAPKLSGVGEDGYIRIYSMKQNGEQVITSLPTTHALYSIGEITDYWDVTAGKLVKNIDSISLNGDERSIDLFTANKKYTVFGITNVIQHRAISFPGFSNYFVASDMVLDGQEQGFTYDTASPQNIYISIDNDILTIENDMSVEAKISKFRNWLRQCNADGNPVTFLWVLDSMDNVFKTNTYKIPQFRFYTRIYNNYEANMEIRLHVAIDLNKGEIVMAGLYEEGPIDLSDKLPSHFENDIGYYDSHLIKAIRLYQKTHDIGQDTEFGRYYSGVLDVPTYNAMKLEFGLQEEVIG